MVEKPEIMAETGLQFFGQISASISHEIKNALAIINEHAGLLEDLTLMADRGIPVDPVRLKTMAAAVKKQVGRADGIIKNMNLFAHSIDQKFATVDLAQTIELAIALTARFAAMRMVKVALQLPENPVAFKTAPFFLINLLWRCLDFSMSASGAPKRVEIVAEERKNSIRIQFKQLSGLAEAQLKNFPSETEKYLLEVLNADLTIAKESHAIDLQLSNAGNKELNP
jgi:C4-dicarboxylate-specific signal transduction histidine kinase